MILGASATSADFLRMHLGQEDASEGPPCVAQHVLDQQTWPGRLPGYDARFGLRFCMLFTKLWRWQWHVCVLSARVPAPRKLQTLMGVERNAVRQPRNHPPPFKVVDVGPSGREKGGGHTSLERRLIPQRGSADFPLFASAISSHHLWPTRFKRRLAFAPRVFVDEFGRHEALLSCRQAFVEIMASLFMREGSAQSLPFDLLGVDRADTAAMTSQIVGLRATRFRGRSASDARVFRLLLWCPSHSSGLAEKLPLQSRAAFVTGPSQCVAMVMTIHCLVVVRVSAPCRSPGVVGGGLIAGHLRAGLRGACLLSCRSAGFRFERSCLERSPPHAFFERVQYQQRNTM